jgi:Phage integrase family
MMRLLANHFERPEAKALTDFRKRLPAVERWHQKTDPIHTISPAELEGVGLALLDEARRPLDPTTCYSYSKREGRQQRCISPGLFRALACETGLIIRLWWRVPIRSRSMREMDITPPTPGPQSTGYQPRLYRDDQGVWQLRYQGEQLKIGERRGKINEFRVPFPAELVPHLEEYLERFRPLIPNAAREPHLFLTQKGKPMTQYQIWQRVSVAVYKGIRKRLYPHLLRTIWTDLYLLSSGGDIDTAAYMLNDNPMTVLGYYHELRAERQVSKAYDFNQKILGGEANGKRTSR